MTEIYETYEKCRTVEAIDRVLEFIGTDEFRNMIRMVEESGEGWWNDVTECRSTLIDTKEYLLRVICGGRVK